MTLATTPSSIAQADRTEDVRPPVGETGFIGWVRHNLFSSWISSVVTLVLIYFLLDLLVSFIGWAFIDAVWSVPPRDTSACRADGAGACWALITEKNRFILFGTYPFEQHWRPALACILFVALYVISTRRSLWNWRLGVVWGVGLTLIGVLMWGGVPGLPFVTQELWGGLPITLILATFGIVGAFPLAILLALGRRAERMPAIRALCVVYIELIRGVPLISVLFMASVMFPLFLPEGLTIDKLLRAQVAIIMFAAAYLAEVIRGGLQALPRGQYEAADAMGLGYWQKMLLIILPQALRITIPPLVNTFIGLFKDTSLVLIIGIFDLLNAAKTSILEPWWQGFGVEAYITVSLIYFVFCFAMSKYSQKLEVELNKGARR